MDVRGGFSPSCCSTTPFQFNLACDLVFWSCMLLGLYITFLWYGMYLLVFTWINRALGLKRVAPKVGVFSCWDKLRFRGEGKKAIGFISKTTTLHAHQALLYISLPSLPDYNMKVPEFTFCRGREHKTTTFFSFPELWYNPLKFNSMNICQHLTK